MSVSKVRVDGYATALCCVCLTGTTVLTLCLWQEWKSCHPPFSQHATERKVLVGMVTLCTAFADTCELASHHTAQIWKLSLSSPGDRGLDSVRGLMGVCHP